MRNNNTVQADPRKARALTIFSGQYYILNQILIFTHSHIKYNPIYNLIY